MDRIINIKVKGNHLTKDSNNAGTRGEVNVTTLRITFGDDWIPYVKKILFWDAHGMNSTKYTLIPEWKENSEANVYLINIPPSALGIAGNMTLRIDGYTENKRQRSVSATLEIEDALVEDEIEEITPSDLDNLLAQGENIKNIINKGVNDTFGYRNEAITAETNAKAAQTAAETAQVNAEKAMETAVSSVAIAVSASDAARWAQVNAENARDAALSYAGNAEYFMKQAEQFKEDAVTAQSEAQEQSDHSQDFAEQAEAARNEARAYAENFESLSEAVERAENAKQTAIDNANASDTFRQEAAKSAESASNYKDSAYDSQKKASVSANQASQSAEDARNTYNSLLEERDTISKQVSEAKETVASVEYVADEAKASALAAVRAQDYAITYCNGAKTYSTEAKASAAEAKYAVSKVKYIGENGNWFEWDSENEVFYDTGVKAPFYGERRCLIFNREISGNDGDWGFYAFPWDDSSIKKNDGDSLILHITSATGEEAYAEISLYYIETSPYGDKGVDCLGTWFGYMGYKNDEGYYTGLNFACPADFIGTLEVYDTVITQIDEKFIPDEIVRKEAVTIEEWEHLGTSVYEDEGERQYLDFSEPIKVGEEYKIIEHDAENGATNVYEGVFSESVYANTYSFTSDHIAGAPYCTFDVYKKITVPIKDKISEMEYAYTNPVKIGEGVPDSDGLCFVNCSEDINEGDTITIKGYFEDGTNEECTVTVPYGFDKDAGPLTVSERLGAISMATSTVLSFTCEIKGEVYKLTKKPVTEGVAELYNIVNEIDTALDRVIEKYGLGDDGFVLPDGAFAIEDGMSIPKGEYKFVMFKADNGDIYTSLAEKQGIAGAVGVDDASLSSCELTYNQNLVVSNNSIIIGFNCLSTYEDGSYIDIDGTTYVVKVG